MAEVESRWVLVTGASQGIGKAIVMRLADNGHCVLGVSRRKPEFPDAAQFHAVNRIKWTAVDLSHATGIEEYAASLEAVAIRALILSAVDYGDGGRHPASATSASEWQRVITTNLIGQCVLVSLLLPRLVASAPGVIIHVSSDVAVTPAAGRSAYAASKAGTHAMLRAVAAEHALEELRVYQLIPTFQTVTNGIRRRRPTGFNFSSYADPVLIAEVVERILSSPCASIPAGTYLVRQDGTLDWYGEVASL
jgi:NAD(P)-dependent dehydrogenase (short-subunit alcohol dehydrogenase family)